MDRLMVRADTLDLQNQENPTAAEHTKRPDQDGLAPHQAAEVHHVIQERRSEENSLADAWKISSSLAEEPGAIDGAQTNDDQYHATNGTRRDGEENGEGGESEGEGDDDMMDRISSSPSIEDGVYILHSSPPSSVPFTPLAGLAWPVRKSSLSPTPASSPASGIFNTSAPSSLESSPFLQTPPHLPLRRPWTEREASPLSMAVN